MNNKFPLKLRLRIIRVSNYVLKKIRNDSLMSCNSIRNRNRQTIFEEEEKSFIVRCPIVLSRLEELNYKQEILDIIRVEALHIQLDVIRDKAASKMSRKKTQKLRPSGSDYTAEYLSCTAAFTQQYKYKYKYIV